MRRTLKAFMLAAMLGVLVSCGSDGGNFEAQLALRFIQASPDAPRVNFLIDGVVTPPPGGSTIDYKGGTGFTFLLPGTYPVAMEGIFPGDDEVIYQVSPTLVAGRQYTTIAIGKLGDDTVHFLRFDNLFVAPIADITLVQFVHAAPDAAAVDIYLTAPGASLAGSTPVVSALIYGQEPPADRQAFASGTYEIRVTPAGDPNTMLLDSGDLTLGSKANLLFVVVANTGPGAAPISIVVDDGTSTNNVLDVATPSRVRVMNVSPDLPSLDARAERALKKDTQVPDPPPAPPSCLYDAGLSASDVLCIAPPPEITSLVDNLPYPASGTYVDLDAGLAPPAGFEFLGPRNSYALKVTASADPDTTLFSYSLSLPAGERITLYALGLVPQPDGGAVIAKALTVSGDDIRSVTREGKLRIVDASPAGNSVDVYIVAPGTDLALVEPTLFNVGLGFFSVHQPLAPGDYTVVFTTASTKDVLASANVSAADGSVQTVVLVDAARPASADGLPLGTLLTNDRLP